MPFAKGASINMVRKATHTISNTSRFVLRDFSGKEVAWFEVEEVDLTQKRVTVGKRVGHHIIVVDCSGSMHAKIARIRDQIKKVMAVAEFKQPTLLFSLLSISDHGDCKEHFARVPATEVLVTGGKYLAEIDGLQPRCLTGLSQGLVHAEKMVNDAEMTVITLMSDGYANDPSVLSEKRAIDSLLTRDVGSLGRHPNLVVNTVAHGDYTDFATLSRIANACSGTCVQSDDVTAKGFYDTLHKVNKLLTGNASPVLEIPSGISTLVFLSRSARMVLGHQLKGLTVNGLVPTDDRSAWRFYPVSQEKYNSNSLPVLGDNVKDILPILAFARVALVEGRINDAKYAVVSARTRNLLHSHARALSSMELQEFAAELEEILFDLLVTTPARSKEYGLDFNKNLPSVLAVLGVLNSHAEHFTTNTAELAKVYNRRGLKQVDGTRVRGTTEVVPPAVDVEPIDASADLKIHGFEFNNANASVNMLTSQPVRLVNRSTREHIPSVGGVPMNALRTYRNYTVVGDGTLNMPILPIRILNRGLHTALTRMGVRLGEYSPGSLIDLRLSDLPMVEYSENFTLPVDTFDKLLRLTILGKILGEMVKRPSAMKAYYSPEQLEQLDSHCISAKLYYNPPRCNEHPDSRAAMAEGFVDVRPSYTISLGSTQITNLSKLHSANEAFDRRFTVTERATGVAVAATFAKYDGERHKVEVKTMSRLSRITPVDEIEFPIYAAVLGVGPTIFVSDILDLLGYDRATKTDVVGALLGTIKGERRDNIISDTAFDLNARIEEIYATLVRPLVFYIGASGVLPQSLDAVSYTAEQLESTFPEVKLAKAEKATGMFFVTKQNDLISVFVKNAYFSLPASA
jgi:Mg-chelatase subunit ChlD